MVTGSTFEEVSSSMYKKTLKQAKKLKIQLPPNLDEVYVKSVKDYNKGSENNKRFQYRSIEEYDKFSGDHKKIEHKKNNRWLLKFPKELNISEWTVSSMTRPTYPFFENNSISIVLRDLIHPSTTDSLMPLINQNDGLSPKKFKLKLLLVDPIGSIIEKWTLKDCMIKRIEWSELDYSNDAPSLINLEVSYNDLKFKKI
jgi:hypothetical protein